ncbi:MAG: hypothetical protein AAGJ40_10595 [Planctomycetota bacterium]
MRHLFRFAFAVALLSNWVQGSEPAQSICTILNTTDHPVVIGLYRPTPDGMVERLVTVAPKTQIDDIPIEIVADSQFAIAYSASTDEGTISRSDPIAIVGHRQLSYLKELRVKLIVF